MGAIARMKSKSGGSQAPISLTVAASDLSLLDRSDVFVLVNTSGGSISVPTIGATMPTHPGRQITLIGGIGNTGDIVLTNNSDSVTKGQMDLGGDITLGTEDSAVLAQQANGVWFELGTTNN